MTNTIWPYLLRTLAIARSNHVWAMDITYIPMARGFVYLAAVIDWHSRRVLAWCQHRTTFPQFRRSKFPHPVAVPVLSRT